MARLRGDGVIETQDGRQLYGDDQASVQDILELIRSFAPVPQSGFIASGGGGSRARGRSTGTGTAGAQGPQGPDGGGGGAQGAQGPQGGIGPQGDIGLVGAQGPQGTETPKAATLVVDPTPGVGDYTTIQDAIDNLPAEGGYILVREGTYAITTTITLPDKPVVIRGCGEGTIVDLGANAIVAFTIPDGLTDYRDYVFEDLFISGTGGTANYGWQIGDSLSLGFVHCLRVKTDGIQKIVDFFRGRTASDGNFFFATECWFRPNADGSSQLANQDGPSSFFNNTVYFDRSWYYRDTAIDGVFGKLCEDGAPRIDFIINGSVLNLSGINDAAALAATDSIFHGDPVADPQTFISVFGSFNAYLSNQLRNCEFRSIHIEAFTMGGSIVGCRFDNCEVLGIADQFYMVGNVHVSDDGTVGTQQVTIDSGVVAYSRFVCPAEADAWCVWTDASKVVGNVFEPSGVGIAALRVSQENYIAGNTFAGASGTSLPPVLEVFGFANIYDGNYGYNPQGVAFPSSFTDDENIYDGVAAAPFTGNATTTLATVLRYRNRNCIVPVVGVFRNQGAVNITVTENWTPVVGAPASRVTVVGAGTDLLLDAPTPPGGTNPPFTEYNVQVQAASGSQPYTIRMALAGGNELVP